MHAGLIARPKLMTNRTKITRRKFAFFWVDTLCSYTVWQQSVVCKRFTGASHRYKALRLSNKTNMLGAFTCFEFCEKALNPTPPQGLNRSSNCLRRLSPAAACRLRPAPTRKRGSLHQQIQRYSDPARPIFLRRADTAKLLSSYINIRDLEWSGSL